MSHVETHACSKHRSRSSGRKCTRSAFARQAADRAVRAGPTAINFALAEHELTSRREVCRTADLCDRLEALLTDEGLMSKSSQCQRVHPAAAELRRQRVTLARLIAVLRIPADTSDGRTQARPLRGIYAGERRMRRRERAPEHHGAPGPPDRPPAAGVATPGTVGLVRRTVSRDPVAAGQGRPRPGMTYRVEVAPAAIRQLRKLDPSARRRVQAAIELLAEQPRPSGARKLVGGDGEWRVRTGDYRVVYEIRDDVLLVLVAAIGHRRDIYRRP